VVVAPVLACEVISTGALCAGAVCTDDVRTGRQPAASAPVRSMGASIQRRVGDGSIVGLRVG
jgi:hypothetical protein